MHRLLAQQLKSATGKDAVSIDIDALIALVDRTYDAFDRAGDHVPIAAYQQTSSLLTAILDNASDGLLVTRRNGVIDIANSAAEKQFAAVKGGLAGRRIRQLLQGLDEALSATREPIGTARQVRAAALDGRNFPAEISVKTLDLPDGPRELFAVRDISERATHQREMMESRSRFQDFAEASSDCFWEIDETLTEVHVSSATELELAARMQALLQPHCGGGTPQNVGEDGFRTLRRHIATRQRFRVRIDIRKDDGETLYVSVSGKPVFDAEQRFQGYRGTARDITREEIVREDARRAERRLIEAMDASPCAIALLDARLNLMGGNSALHLLAARRRQLLPFGRNFLTFLSGAWGNAIGAEELRAMAAAGRMTEAAVGESWYLIAARTLSDGGMVLTFSDVTALKQRECELAEAKLSAESASRLKSQFLATMSHELRTPLNAILGFSEVIRDSVFGRGANAIDKYAEYAGSIYASGKHLLSLISEILDLSKIEAGSYVLDTARVNVCQVLESALTIIAPAATKAGVEIRNALPNGVFEIVADERALRQIALNLLANAVKFTPMGGSVTVELAKRDAEVEFSIADTGIGIAKEHLDAVFEVFRQVDESIRRRHEGTGLGLAITKRLVELHGGKIEMESEVGVGTTVRVKLPARLPASLRQENAEPAVA